jgi:hypothetical protein
MEYIIQGREFYTYAKLTKLKGAGFPYDHFLLNQLVQMT